MTNKLYWILLLLAPCWGISQDHPVFLQAGYIGETITHSGLTIGLSQQLWSSDESALGQTPVSSLRWGVKAAAIYHRRMHTSLKVTPHVDWIRTQPNGFEWGASLALGYKRAFIPDVFEANEEGTFKFSGAAGTNHTVMLAGVRLGKNLSIRKDLPLSIYVQPQWMIQTPYFLGSTHFFLVEAGITYQLNRS